MLRAINVRFRYGRQSFLAGYLHPTVGAVEIDGAALPVSGCCPVQMAFQNPELAINPFFRMSKVLSEATAELGDLPHVFGIEATWLSRLT